MARSRRWVLKLGGRWTLKNGRRLETDIPHTNRRETGGAEPNPSVMDTCTTKCDTIMSKHHQDIRKTEREQ